MKTIKKSIFYFVFFYLIYLPNLSFLGPFFSSSNIIFGIAILNIILLNRKLLAYFEIFKLNWVTMIYLFTLIQLILLNLFNEFKFINLWPNIQFIIQLINFLALLIWSKKLFGNRNNIETNLIFVGMVQAVTAILMFIFPPFKEIANFLATNGEELELNLVSLLSFRMYGIGSSYTFMLPLIQSFIAIISLRRFLILNNSKYLVFSILILISSILNNRTGFYIYLVATLLLIIHYTAKKLSVRSIIILFSSTFMFFSLLLILKNLFSERFEWLTQGFIEVSNAFTGREVGGTLGALESHWEFPTGINFLIGHGTRVFGQLGISNFGFTSDIGFVNDMFKGGLLYLLLTYTTHIVYNFKNSKDKFFMIILIISLMISNYKGEVMVASPLIFIMYLLTIQDLHSEMILGEKNYEYI